MTDGTGSLPPSPAGPAGTDAPRTAPPVFGAGRLRQSLRISADFSGELAEGARRHGDVFAFRSLLDELPVAVVSHPDHLRSLFAEPRLAPSLAGESPVRPVVGLSVLTMVGDDHRRRRKLLMPPFHGEAVARYQAQIEEATARQLDRWEAGATLRLADAAQAITLDVIMAGVFGIDRRTGEAERRLRTRVRQVLRLSTSPVAKAGEFVNLRSAEPVGPQKWVIGLLDRAMFAVIAERRAAHAPGERHDILSLLLDARDEDGSALTDVELRNELLTLVLAGHETTANTVAWAFERLTRTPAAYDRLREEVRSGGEEYLEATVKEAMRARPVVPVVARRPSVPWRFGDFVVPAETRVVMAILLTHHREDLYPDPERFDPDRFVGVRPSPYAWLPFGGGDRRCLGAALAMAELRVVLREMARRADFAVTDAPPERPRHRNVTMIPAQGGRVRLLSTRP
ncbi:MAG: cytochrome P450 [Aeromicrobium sp.]|uniref:cytochrome P450 n=1 Tax=Aeromicrobium sp. TaxID=1871063 RepID=UPI0039E4BCEF